MRPASASRIVGMTWPALVIVALSGCTAAGPRGEIPAGQWTGQGVLIYEHWKPADEKTEGPQPQSINRAYPTRMSIRPAQLDGREVIELEIRSERGPLPGMEGKATHLKAALVKAKRVSDSMVLYRLVDLLVNPGADEALGFDDGAPPFGASCITVNGTTTVQIEYMDNFVDTVRFKGDHVEKSGVYFDIKEGLIHWVEHLTRSK